MTYLKWDEDEHGDVLDVRTYCVLHAPRDADRWPCYGDQLNPGEVAYCEVCSRPVAFGPDTSSEG